ncbi:YcxB family protein [Kribbella sp. NPDC051718]|uniref:YcxB family protein n=1 Tax=Kribbella sp. NPDC051718 TaxID=3155168 RepID=UPI00342C9E7E
MNIAVPVEVTLGRRLRNARLQMRWVGWALRAAGVGYLIWGLVIDDGAINVLGLIFIGYPELIGVIRHLAARKYGPVYTYTLTDEGLRIATAITDLRYSWSAVKSLREASGQWNFRFAGAGASTVPTAGFSPEQDAEWRAFIAAHGLVPA